MQVSQSSYDQDFWASSVPDIQVYQRRQSAERLDSVLSFEESFVEESFVEESFVGESFVEESFAMESFDSQDPFEDEEYQSYLEDVHTPETTLFGRVVFWTVSSVCTVAILAMALSHIWAHGQATRLGFAYSQASKQATRLKEERRLLKLQLAKLKSPERLSRIAEQQLGMQLPERAYVISEKQVIEKLHLTARNNKKKRLRFASSTGF